MNIKVVESEKEIQQAYSIRTTVFVEEQKVAIEEEIDELEEESIHFVGYIDEAPILASRLRMVDHYGKLERICILKEHRGKSYGAQIIQEMEDLTLNKGYTKAKLNAQTQAIGFYEKLGYSVVSGEFLDAGIPHVTMTKKLI